MGWFFVTFLFLSFGFWLFWGADRISGGLLAYLRLYDTGGELDAAVPRGDGVY